MLASIRSKFQSTENKLLLSNFFSLSLLQVANYLLPLITLPYLVRVLGVEYFGLLAFATATITYFNILTDYGFNLTATREISIHKENKEKISEIFSSVMTIKFVLMILSFILLTIVVFSFDRFNKYWFIYFLTFGTVIGHFLFPVWFFQGMQRMKYITYLNVLAKSIFTIAVFLFVKEEKDFYLVPILTSSGFIFSGFLSLFIVKQKFNIVFRIQKINKIRYHLIESSKVFSGMFSYSLITTSTVFVLGFFTSDVIVGYFSAVQRLIKGIAGLVNPISQALYPYLTNIYVKDKRKAFMISLRTTLVYIVFSTFLLTVLFFFPKQILSTIYGQSLTNERVIFIFKVFSFFPLLYGVVHIFCTQTLLISKHYKIYKSILFFGFIFSLVLGYFLIMFYAEIGAAFSLLTSELIIILLSVFFIKKLKIK